MRANVQATFLNSWVDGLSDSSIFSPSIVLSACSDCCGHQSTISQQAQVYSILKDLDPFHPTIGAVNCDNSWLFRDVPSYEKPTTDRSSTWLSRGQPQLQLSLDLVMQENYAGTLAEHAGTGQWGGPDVGPGSPGRDGSYRNGMFQEPVVNCNGNIFLGKLYPQAAANGTFPTPFFKSMLWLGSVTSNMVNQLTFIMSPTASWWVHKGGHGVIFCEGSGETFLLTHSRVHEESIIYCKGKKTTV